MLVEKTKTPYWKTVIGTMPPFEPYEKELVDFNRARGNGIYNMRDLNDNLIHLKTRYNFLPETLVYFLTIYVNTPRIDLPSAIIVLAIYEAGLTGDYIATEVGDRITTEAGDHIIPE